MPDLRPILVMLWLGFAGALMPLAGQQPAFRRFGLRDGLPQSQVTSLLEDRNGFLWVGTNTGGVARLGAAGFTSFAGPQGLQSLLVRALLESPSGSIWVASQGGVSEIRGETVLNYGPAQGLEAPDAITLGLDWEDQVLVGNRSGLFRLQEGRFSPVTLPGPWPGGPVRRLARDSSKGVWLVGSGRTVARWDATGLQLYPAPGTSRISDLSTDAAGRAWLLLEEALFRMDRGRWVPVPLKNLPASPRMLTLRFDAQGEGFQIALGGDGVLIREPNGQDRVLTSASGLPRDRIAVAMRSRRGVLWVGSDGDGLAALALPSLTAIEGPRVPSGPDLGAVSGILELSAGRFLLGTSTGLYQVDEGRGVTFHWTVGQGLPANECWGLLPDGRGGVWVGTDRGLARWKDGRVTATGPRELARIAVVTLARNGDGLFAGTERGLFELDGQGRLRAHHHLPPDTGNDTVSNILNYEGRWIVATGFGLWELVEGHLRQVFTDAPFAASTVTAAALDGHGRLWIGSMKGLHLKTGSGWATYGVADGLPDECINFIVDVGQGRLAFGHNKGVTLLDGRNLHHLTRSQGLVSEETNHDGFLLDSKGRLWIGMIGGVCILQDVRTFHNAPSPAPTLLEIRWPGGSATPMSEASIPPRPDFLDLDFDTGDPLAPSRVHYQAFLQGVDEGWRPAGQGHTIQYRNLGAGNYRFRIRGSSDGVTWTEGPPVSLVVPPAWYEDWLVRGMVGLALLGILGWIMWLRVHTLAKRSRMLEETIEDRTRLLARQNRALEHAHQQIKRSLESRLKLLDMVTHDLRSPLTTILLSLDRLRELAPTGTYLLDAMERESHRIETLLRNLLDQSRSEALLQSLKLVPIMPAEVTEGFEDVLRLKAEAKGLAFHLEVAPETEQVRILADTATLHQVMLNLFENALKFTPAGGQVGIRSWVDRADDLWSLEVWDTGRGLDTSKIQEILAPFRQTQADDAAQGWGLGLSICQTILDVHQGELKVESEPGLGARFRMVLPLQPVAP